MGESDQDHYSVVFTPEGEWVVVRVEGVGETRLRPQVPGQVTGAELAHINTAARRLIDESRADANLSGDYKVQVEPA